MGENIGQKKCIGVIEEDMTICGVNKNMVSFKKGWGERIGVVDPIYVGRRRR